MRGPAGRCPNCSAPIAFRWSSAVQTVCDNCRSVVVRHDVDLDAIGEVSDLPPDSSPIQRGTTGRFEDRPFTVTGRIVYEYADGGWNEWHLAFDDGRSGWLSDAQGEYAVSMLVKEPPQPLPAGPELELGFTYTWQDQSLQLTTLTRARYVGVEGELPFEYWGKTESWFADLRSHDRTFATFDYSDESPLLFVGRFVEYDDLSLRGVRSFEGEVTASASLRGFNCSECGAAIELRSWGHARTVACTSCGTVLDPRDRNVHVLQTAALRESITPLIPLGSRGTWHGHPYDVIGFQQRSIAVDDVRYHWDEYVLFNPYRGFRYLSYYQGHWNDIETVRELPRQVRVGGRPEMACRGETFKHFQAATARTDFVLGEFPWRVRVGDTVAVSDYVAPPLMLSGEGTDADSTWSIGRYTDGRTLWQVFSVPGDPPRPIGVFANQPYPHHRRVAAAVAAFFICAGLLLVLLLVRAVTADREQVFSGDYRFVAKDAAFVTDPFTVSEDGTVEIEIAANNLSNSWIEFDLALINLETGTAWNVWREVSYYFGTDSDGAWSEGSREEQVLLPAVPAGQYYLRVEPVSDTVTNTGYSIRVRRDVVSLTPYVLALLALSVPAVLAVVHRASFEQRRLQESDYGE